MLAVPPAVIVLPLASKEQVLQTVNYVVGRLKQIGASIRHMHLDTPLYLECKVTRDVVERVDVYLATANGDFVNVLPPSEEIKEGFVEKRSYIHLVQGVAVYFKYELGAGPKLAEVVIYSVGNAYRDFKLNL
ncbi:conserved hypothetical protein [Pyrobaculum islandicum DSM 4184]|uniref:Uncharacterized protein n=1 Tax=Pyrobaculum islandicum (strain DSM 4184 / JCM 9189 / GEO3) TaxID=384616 RepID=A1RRE6_PYRIL|nr:hypothetical protein [Pyrobaculum islandicum]ABL87528.1 conserved hypothetical protein [Pyrobaculum islandicum DSM 4184]